MPVRRNGSWTTTAKCVSAEIRTNTTESAASRWHSRLVVSRVLLFSCRDGWLVGRRGGKGGATLETECVCMSMCVCVWGGGGGGGEEGGGGQESFPSDQLICCSQLLSYWGGRECVRKLPWRLTFFMGHGFIWAFFPRSLCQSASLSAATVEGVFPSRSLCQSASLSAATVEGDPDAECRRCCAFNFPVSFRISIPNFDTYW